MKELRVFQEQPGFISYRLMRASNDITVAIAEWESEELRQGGCGELQKMAKSERHLRIS